jgi:short-subunit dehydrogenase
MSKTILIIGATSSLAEAICQTLAKRGHALILCGRDEDALTLLASDLAVRFKTPAKIIASDFLSADFSPEKLMVEAGECDEIIIAVGDMGNGEAFDAANLAYTAYINYTLPAQIVLAAAEQVKPPGGIVIISSIAGDRGRQSNIAYGSAKAGLTAFASGLRNRLHKKGVHVMTVKPGFTDTPMTWGMKSPLIASREYVARKIVAAMERKEDEIYVPFFWYGIMLIIRHIPEAIFKRMKL